MLVLHKTVMLIKTWKPLLKPKSKLNIPRPQTSPKSEATEKGDFELPGHRRTAVVGEAAAL